MDARSVSLYDELEEPAPATARVPATQIARLVAQTLPPREPSDIATPFAGDSAIDPIAGALRAEEEMMNLMRNLYLQGETERALIIGAQILPDDDDDDDIEELLPEDLVDDDDDDDDGDDLGEEVEPA